MIPNIGVDVLVGLVDKLTSPLKDQEQAIAKASERMNKSLKLSLKLSGAGAAASGFAWGAKRLVTNFTDSIRDVEKAKGDLATLGVQDLDAVVRRGQEMQTQLAGVTADAFVRASYDIKSGISSLTDQGVADMTASAMITAKATKGQAEQMTSLFATSYGIFKKHMGDLTDAEFGEQFGAALSASVQQFKTDGAAMQQAIESAGAGAVNLGMDMTEQLTLLGMMQQQMQSGEAGTALRAFATNAAKAHEAFGKMKVTADRPVRVRILDENGQLREMPDILADLKTRYGDTLDAFEATEIKSAFGTDEAMKMINALYGQEAAVRANANALDAAAGKGAEFTKEMARAADNNWDATMVLMSQKMDVIRQKIGDRFLPLAKVVAERMDVIVDKALAWIDTNPKLITGIGAIVVGLGTVAAVIGPLLLGAGTLVSGWGMMTYGATRLFLSLAPLAKWIGVAGKGLLWLGRAVLPLVGKAVLMLGRALIANPIGLVISAIAGAAYLIYRNWEPISDFFADMWGKVSNVTGAAWGWLRGLFDRYNPRHLLLKLWDRVSGFFAGLWAKVKTGVEAGWSLIKSIFMTYHPLGILLSNWDGVSEWFSSLWDRILAGARAGWDTLKHLFLNYTAPGLIYTHWEGISEWFSTIWDRVKTTFKVKWDQISAEVATWPAAMKDYGAQLIDRMIDGITSRIPFLNRTMRGIRSSIDPNALVTGVSRGPIPAEEDPNKNPNRNSALLNLYGINDPVQKRATGGDFRTGWLLTGENGPELKYENKGGWIAHNGLLRGMVDMASRAQELISGIDFGALSPSAPLPALANVAATGGRGHAAPLTFSPQYNIPMHFERGVNIEEVREAVREELADANERAQVELRSLLHD